MRYMARRINTGEWLDRDLPLTGVERTRTLSGPGLISATIEPELRAAIALDGRRVLEEWGTQIVCADDTGPIRNVGIFIGATYAEGSIAATCAGHATYPHGYPYDGARNWGPVSSGKTSGGVPIPAVDRPDPLAIVQDHWDWIQAQQDSDLGVRLVGTLKSSVRIGSYEEPYRLRWWETPDLGTEIDNLAASTPFDYVEEYAWADRAEQSIDLRIRLGHPRLGIARSDLRFALGENVTDTIEVATEGDAFANDVLGIGRGEGSQMVRSRARKRDGRLRRTRIVTDKTATQRLLDARTSRLVESLATSIDITSVSIREHANAPISSIGLGDDIYVQTYLPTYGAVEMWLRVLGISENEHGDTAVLSTSRSDGFTYNPNVEIAS